MNVLSVFDGMSCGQIALRELGINVNKYYSSEINKCAISQTQLNFPDTIQLGSIDNWHEWDINWKEIDLILAGSPCQGFSRLGLKTAFEHNESRLYFFFIEILNFCKKHNPDVKFLLENVVMKKEYVSMISNDLMAKPIKIDSALFSAQRRKRLYWTNINVINDLFYSLPKINNIIDKKIYLCDILDKNVDNKYYLSDKGQNYVKKRNNKFTKINGIKSMTLLVNGSNKWVGTFIEDDRGIRKLTPNECCRLQTIPEWYKFSCSDTSIYTMLGNGWTIDVIKHILKDLKNV